MLSKIIKTYRGLTANCWNIALCDTPVDDTVKGKELRLRWLKHKHKESWFADPFILRADDEVVEFLVEEFVYSTKLGRISRLIADRKTMQLKEIRPILELDSHLSFPAIMRKGNEIYIYPENGTADNLTLYHYDPATDRCTKVEKISDRPLADAIICEIHGRKYMLTTSLPEPNGAELEVLTMEHGHPEHLQTVVFERNTGRNAGDIFKVGDTYYRPAQEKISDEYGAAISLQRIDSDGDGKLSFSEVAVYKSPSARLELGFHTFNVHGDLIVVDAKGYRYPFIARILKGLRSLTKNKKAV
mgnify:CR=1 FL=1